MTELDAIENREIETSTPLELLILDQSGHLKQIWDRSIPDEVAMAKKVFNKMIDKGYAAFKVNKDGSQGSKISAFDPEAEKMILAPALRGG
jgi:hypothetical protein